MPFGSEIKEEKKPCRTCTDFKTWAKNQNNVYRAKLEDATGSQSSQRKYSTKSLHESGQSKYGCPLDKDQLGHSTWNLLHTMAAAYPDHPSEQQKTDVKSLFGILSRQYPCDVCAKDLTHELQSNPVVTSSNQALSQWLCRLHNRINEKIGKPEFDCSKVNERWRDGWHDGSCD